jgi:hypothetical protein
MPGMSSANIGSRVRDVAGKVERLMSVERVVPPPPLVRDGGRRRIDRVLDPGFLAGIDTVPVEVLRERRQEALQEEADLSFLRRLLQGRIDIVRAELARRSGGATGGLEAGQDDMVARLPRILSDAPSERAKSVRHLTVRPSRMGEYRREFEAMLADVELSDVRARDDAELAVARATLEGYERQVSTYRRAVQQVTDRCGAELTRRYRDGNAKIDDLLDAEQAATEQ